MNIYLSIVVLISFLIVLIFMKPWIKKTKQINLMWEDMNKFDKHKVAGSGGIIVLLAFVVSLMIFIGYRTFFLESSENLIEVMGLMLSVIILANIGLIDDLLGWQRGGLRRRDRIILVGLAAIPLVVLNAGRSTIFIPILGIMDIGIIYPLILIPIGIIGAATTFNFLAGFNGLEAGQGIILLSALSLVAYLTGSSWLAIAGLCMVFALLGFMIYNFYPSKVFPGDSLTYSVGGLIAIMAILGNFEKIALFFFIPYLIEVALKSRGKLIKSSFGKPNQDGSLELLHSKIYSLNHLAILIMQKTGIKPTEKRAVISIWLFQILIVIIGFLIFRGNF